jgi:hypothetical protein
MKSFFTVLAVSTLTGLGAFQASNSFNTALALWVASVVIYLLHRIEQHLFHQTVLMVQDEEGIDEDSIMEHPPYPIEDA